MRILNNFHPKLDWTFSLMISTILPLFAGSVEYGGDRAQLKYDLACMLPLSIIIFAVSTAASRVVFSGLV
jgi:hypothetical protein